ncbi:MAG: LacI family DNA-binding transcriptional regulator [Lentisphaeria bacterium]|nr:LacI family DNA-binding transcriptional regulator [Lentisphaeria bacterium]
MAGVTLKKLAELSGLSIRTVNRVLKDQGDVSPEKRALVRKLAAEYNYMPNIAARNFRLRRNNVVGVVMCDRMLCEANMQKLADLERTLTSGGYYPLLGGACDRDIRRILEEWNGTVGVVVIFNYRHSRGMLPVKDYPYTFILVDGDDDGSAECHRVTVDRESGISEVCAAFVDAGCRRLVHCGTATLRAPLVRRCAEKLRGRAEFLHIETGRSEFEDGFSAGAEIMQSGADAVFFDTDRMAAGFYRYAWEHRIRIPDDISVAGFDDDAASSVLSPPLSSVAHPVAEISAAVMALIVENPPGPETRVLSTRFVRRASIRG